MVSYDTFPKLFSLLFGESVINDAVAIILFNTVSKFNEVSMGLLTIPQVILGFFILTFASLFIGLFYGVLCALALKHVRSLTREAVSECIVLFSFAYLCYVTAERFH